MVYRFQLTYDEILGILGLKYIPSKRIVYSLQPGVYEIADLSKILKRILRDNVKVFFTNDDIILKSSFKKHQTLMFTKKSSFYNTFVLFKTIRE